MLSVLIIVVCDAEKSCILGFTTMFNSNKSVQLQQIPKI